MAIQRAQIIHKNMYGDTLYSNLYKTLLALCYTAEIQESWIADVPNGFEGLNNYPANGVISLKTFLHIVNGV